MEFVGDSLLDISYDLVRGFVLVYGTWKPDSVLIELYAGTGFKEALKIKWNQGYAIGHKNKSDWEMIRNISFGIVFGAAIVYGITQLKAER